MSENSLDNLLHHAEAPAQRMSEDELKKIIRVLIDRAKTSTDYFIILRDAIQGLPPSFKFQLLKTAGARMTFVWTIGKFTKGCRFRETEYRTTLEIRRTATF